MRYEFILVILLLIAISCASQKNDISSGIEQLFGSEKCKELKNIYNNNILNEYNNCLHKFSELYDFDENYNENGLSVCLKSFNTAKNSLNTFRKKYGNYCVFNYELNFLEKEIDVYRYFLFSLLGEFSEIERITKHLKAYGNFDNFFDHKYQPRISSLNIHHKMMVSFTLYCNENKNEHELDNVNERLSLVVLLWGSNDKLKDFKARSVAIKKFNSDKLFFKYLKNVSTLIFDSYNDVYPYGTQICMERISQINRILDIYDELSLQEKTLVMYTSYKGVIGDKLKYLTILFGNTKRLLYYEFAQQHINTEVC